MKQEIVPQGAYLLLFCAVWRVEQISTRNAFPSRFVERQRLAGNETFPQAVPRFADNHTKMQSVQTHTFFLQLQEL